MLPAEVLEIAADEMLSHAASGMSIMEISHRSKQFQNVLDHAESGLRELLHMPANYRVLFLQGGATLQFSMVPMNLLAADASADLIITGAWGKKALKETKRYGNANIIFSDDAKGFRRVPLQDEIDISGDARYIHYTSNETIDGVEFGYDLDGGSVPVICDMSSNILSRAIDIKKYAFIYAGAQKNIGPSGVTVVIIREDLLDIQVREMPPLLNYAEIARNGSMLNTPNTWGIYMIGLVCDWLRKKGGVAAIEKINTAKAAKLYAAIDASDGFYRGHADRGSRSRMNVTFRLPNEELEDRFCADAEMCGLKGLRGHRSVGGIRASIYNAFPEAGVDRLIEFMAAFMARES